MTTVVMNINQDKAERIKELMKKKRKLIATMRRGKKIQIKAKIEKKKVNDELKALQGSDNKFRGMTPDQAREKVRQEIEDVKPKDVYPKDLERTFDKLEAPSTGEHKVVDLGKLPERPIAKGSHDDDDGETVGVAAGVDTEEEAVNDDEIVDLSDQ